MVAVVLHFDVRQGVSIHKRGTVMNRMIISFFAVLFAVSGATSAFASESDEHLATLARTAGIEKAREMIKDCRERAVAYSKSLAENASTGGTLGQYTMAVIETTCESEVVYQTTPKQLSRK